METFEQIIGRMLGRIPNSFDKREGSVIYDALAPAAVEIQLMEIQIENFLNEAFADTASREYLIKRAMERGVEPYSASYARVLMETTPTNLQIPVGSRFSLNELNYVITGKRADGEYYADCESLGSEANSNLGICVPIDYIDGLQTCEITDIIVPGENDEETEHFRKRYLESFESQAFGGNIADYKEKTVAIAGVGGVKVTPVWNGGGTVKLTIISADFDVPTPELVALVQNTIDPVGHSGQGVGLAPVGHVVTVDSVTTSTINISCTIDYASGWNWNEVKPYAEQAIDDYFKNLSAEWAAADNLIVRRSAVESALIALNGIVDVTELKLNNTTGNITLGANQIPVRGSITVA